MITLSYERNDYTLHALRFQLLKIQWQYVSFLAPPQAPVLVTAHNSSSTSLLAEWTRLLEEDFRGQPIGYKIIYC